jgi:hypothetical protein
MRKFKKGDHVREHGRQQTMIVEGDVGLGVVGTRSGLSSTATVAGKVLCSWRDLNGKHFQRSFHENSLELVSQTSPTRLSGLAAFAMPGVIEARVRCQEEAVQLIKNEFPFDKNIEATVHALFERLQHQPDPVTASRIAGAYRSQRK